VPRDADRSRPEEAASVTLSTILVVDDDPEIRELAGSTLRDAGHRVIEASTGQEAIVEFEAHDDIDLIFTDIVMPGIDGFKVADCAKMRRPTVRILYTTGFSGLAAEHLGVVHGKILTKPYRQDQLVAVVQQELDQITKHVTG
jgi:CheY-like chemotaxis protein